MVLAFTIQLNILLYQSLILRKEKPLNSYKKRTESNKSLESKYNTLTEIYYRIKCHAGKIVIEFDAARQFRKIVFLEFLNYFKK